MEKKKKKYYPKTYKRIFIQDRDLEIIKYGLEQKFLTVGQVARRFFPTKPGVKDEIQAGYKRMLTLQKFELVKLAPILTGEKVILVTRAGASQLDSRGIERFGTANRVDYRYFEHDKRVTDVRILLEKLDLVDSWQCERQLRKDYSKMPRVPDAVFDLKNGQRVGLEVEVAKKSQQRYQSIFQEYSRKLFGKMDLVFYVCGSLSQLEHLAEMSKDIRWIYYCVYQQLTTRGKNTMFANIHEHFKLCEL